MITFLKLENYGYDNMAVLVGFNEKHIEFWVNYQKNTMVATFHDNSGLPLGYISGMVAYEVNELTAIDLLKTMSKNTPDRHSYEIDALLRRLYPARFAD